MNKYKITFEETIKRHFTYTVDAKSKNAVWEMIAQDKMSTLDSHVTETSEPFQNDKILIEKIQGE